PCIAQRIPQIDNRNEIMTIPPTIPAASPRAINAYKMHPASIRIAPAPLMQDIVPLREFLNFALPYFRVPLFLRSFSFWRCSALFSFPNIMFSPYSITYQKSNIPEHASDRVQKDIIHIKTPHSRKKLYDLHTQAQSHTEK